MDINYYFGAILEEKIYICNKWHSYVFSLFSAKGLLIKGKHLQNTMLGLLLKMFGYFARLFLVFLFGFTNKNTLSTAVFSNRFNGTTLLILRIFSIYLFIFIWLDVPHLTYKPMHKTASLSDEGNSAYCQSSVTRNIKHICKPMEISIKRSPQHWCSSEGSNSELFAHENDALTAE